MTASQDVLSAVKTLVDPLNGIAAMKRANVWAVLKKLAAVQTFPKHVLHFMTMYYKEERLFKNDVIFLFYNGARRVEDV